MSIVRDSYNGTIRLHLTECPACGHEFGETGEGRSSHIGEHDPEDFGL